MSWFYDKEITLLAETDGYMSRGSWVNGDLQEVKIISCDVQPANKEQIFKDYGYYVDCKKRVFCDVDSEIILGSIVKCVNEYYKIVKLIEWDDYYDIFLDEYKEANNG